MKNTFVVLLKGINVGGHNRIKMAELKAALLKEGFENISTIIQSGNIVLSTSLSMDETQTKFKNILEKQFNLDVPVLVVTPSKMKDALDKFPFFDKSTDESILHITFLNTELSDSEWDEKLGTISLNETYQLNGDILYLYPSEGYHKAKLNATFLANKFKVNATNRNVKTIRKILAKTE